MAIASFRLPDEDIAELRRLAALHRTTATAVLRRAIARESFYADPSIRRAIVEKRDGTLREVMLRG